MYKLISQTKRVSRPTSCFGSKQSGKGKGPVPPGKTRWDLGVTASITSPLTNEQFTEMTHLKGPCAVFLAVNLNLGTIQSGERWFTVKKNRKRKKIETKGETPALSSDQGQIEIWDPSEATKARYYI